MKKTILFIFSLFLVNTILAAPPTRTDTYVSGTTIEPAEVTRNEDAIFNYLQSGVDTLATNSVFSSNIVDGTIISADLTTDTLVITDVIISDGQATLTNSGNNDILTMTNNGSGTAIDITAGGSSTDALIKITRTDAVVGSAFIALINQEHGTDVDVIWQAQNDAGTSKNTTMTWDPDQELFIFESDAHVTGTFTAGTKTFCIDHPIDPYNKSYYHGVIETDGLGLLYDGTVQLVNGQATVVMDTYIGQMAGTFEALVKNDRVRIYLQNNDNWDLVKGSYSNGVLTIESNNLFSNAKIDFLLTTERNDPFALIGRFIDENGEFILEHEKDDLKQEDLDDLAEVENTKNLTGDIEERTVNLGHKKGQLRHPEARGKKIKKIKKIK